MSYRETRITNCLKPAMAGFLLSLMMTLVMSASFAQATTGNITGTIVDQTGAVIVGAAIAVRNVDTNITRIVPTGPEGRYSLPALPIGNYEITIDQPGFGKVVRGPVVLTLDQTAVVDAELKPAGVTSEITTISEDAPILNLANAEVGVRFDEQRLSNLPTQGLGDLSGGGF